MRELNKLVEFYYNIVNYCSVGGIRTELYFYKATKCMILFCNCLKNIFHAMIICHFNLKDTFQTLFAPEVLNCQKNYI